MSHRGQRCRYKGSSAYRIGRPQKLSQACYTQAVKDFLPDYLLLIAVDTLTDHGSQTWQRTHAFTVSVLPNWPGYGKSGFGAPPGVALEGSNVVIQINSYYKSYRVLTAAHLVSRSTDVMFKMYHLRTQQTRITWIDLESDIALFKLHDALPALILVTQSYSPGGHVCVIGNPFGLGVSISCGVIAGPNRQGIGVNAVEDFIQSDAAVNLGSSGCVLVNVKVQLIGMIAALFTKEADIDAGVNFAVSADLLIDRVQ